MRPNQPTLTYKKKILFYSNDLFFNLNTDIIKIFQLDKVRRPRYLSEIVH